MNRQDVKHDLMNHAIDRPGEPLPQHLKKQLEADPSLQKEWQRMSSMVSALKSEDEWTPTEGFYVTLVEKAMQVKRRADLTTPTTRDLGLDRYGWLDLFRFEGMQRWAIVTVLVLILSIPISYYGWNEWNTVGQINYVKGNLIVHGYDPGDIQRKDPIHRGTVVHTPQGSNCSIQLEAGTNVLVSSLSRIEVQDNRRVRVQRGKAYFDITPGKGKFSVQVPEGEIRVLGTAFTVNVEDDKSLVVVERGLVELHADGRSIQVRPKQEGALTPNRAPSVNTVDRMEQRLRWVSRLREEKNKDDLRTYYPSLAPNESTRGGRQ